MLRNRRTWTDISVLLRDEIVRWPSDPPVRIQRLADFERGDGHTFSQISMGVHTGTHVDAPLHFVRGGVSIDEMPLDATVGPARVIQIRDAESIKPGELAQCRVRPGERLLFKTLNSSREWWAEKFSKDAVFLTAEGARWLVDRKIKAVGIDYLSIGGVKDVAAIHRILLASGVWVIENLDLSRVEPGRYDLICLPLRICAEGAPARAILMKKTTRKS